MPEQTVSRRVINVMPGPDGICLAMVVLPDDPDARAIGADERDLPPGSFPPRVGDVVTVTVPRVVGVERRHPPLVSGGQGENV